MWWPIVPSLVLVEGPPGLKVEGVGGIDSRNLFSGFNLWMHLNASPSSPHSTSQASAWTSALHFLAQMQVHGVLPNVFTFNSAISACGHGQQWVHSMALMLELRNKSLLPDTITFNSLMMACQKANKSWSITDHKIPLHPLKRTLVRETVF